MELCTSRALSIRSHSSLFNPNSTHFGWTTLLPPKPMMVLLTNSGLRQFISGSVRAGTFKETETKSTQLYEEGADDLITMRVDAPLEKSDHNGTVQNELSKEEFSRDEQTERVGFLDKLNAKVDPEGAYTFLIYGSSALVSLWLASVVVGAIDSIPVFPKLMEVVGLAYSIWFSTRYLLFKRSRDELGTKIEELKQQVLGLDD